MRRPISSPSAGRLHQRGYALLLMLVMVTMGILFTLVSQLSLVGMKWGRSRDTYTALARAKEALIGYAATYRDAHPNRIINPTPPPAYIYIPDEVYGYLPCPDADGDGNAETINSSTNCGSTSQVVVGLLPFQSLGLNDLRDDSGECLWYAVVPGYKAATNKLEPMNWDTRGQIKILDNDGTTVLADPANGSEGGAVAVIFAAGPPLSNNATGRGSNSSNICGNNGKTAWRAYLESIASDSSGNAGLDANGNSTANPLIVTRGTIDSATNNDQIVWITPKDIFDKVKKRNDRAGLNDLPSQIVTTLQAKINADLVTGTAPVTAAPTNPATVGPTPFAGQVGQLPALTVSTSPIDYTKLLNNWQDQYRYAVCSNLCGYCLTIGGTSCNGALFFGAEHTTGGPRPTQPMQLSDLFENDSIVGNGDGKGALALLSDTAATPVFSGANSYSGGSADAGYCVAPVSAKPVTFNCDLANFSNASLTLSEGNRLVNFNTSSGTLTLGNINVIGGSGGPDPNSNLFGCAWSGDKMNFGNGLRVYFNFIINTLGEGFTFAIMDDANYSAGNPPCGASGSYLGYANGNGTMPSINPPKIGLEFDTYSNSSRNDPSYNHAALIYWGANNTTADSDDNKHGAAAASGYPSNPAVGTSGVSGDLGATGGNILVAGTTVHVRIDIVRNYDSIDGTGTYAIKAWLVTGPGSALLSDLHNTLADFATSASGSSLSPTVYDTITNMPNLSGSEALKKIRVGFANSQRSSIDQSVAIQGFVASVY